MAIKVSEAARGNAKATGMPKQPRGRVFVPGPNLREKDPGGQYGMNHWTGGSSAQINAVTQSPMAKAIAAPKGDPALSALVSKGSAKSKAGDLQGSPQTRPINTSPFAPVHGAVRQQADLNSIGRPTLPASLSDGEPEPERQP